MHFVLISRGDISWNAMAEHFLYLTTTGRKTGLPRQIEIWFVAHAGRYYMVAEGRERAGWVKNLQRDARVRFSVGTRADRGAGVPPTAAMARAISPEREPALAARVRALMDEKYGWSDGLVIELAPEPAPAVS